MPLLAPAEHTPEAWVRGWTYDRSIVCAIARIVPTIQIAKLYRDRRGDRWLVILVADRWFVGWLGPRSRS